MNKNKMIMFNQALAMRIQALSSLIGDMMSLAKHKDKQDEINEAIETLISGRDELYDMLYSYLPEGDDEFVYYGLESWIL